MNDQGKRRTVSICLGHGEALLAKGSLRVWAWKIRRAQRRGRFVRVRDVRGAEVWLNPWAWTVMQSV